MMKGLQPVRSANTIYLSVAHGCLCQQSKVMRDGFDPIELVDRDTHQVYHKYIKPWGGVEAMIVDIQYRADVYEGVPYNSWKIFMRANPGEPDIVLELNLNSNAGDRFACCAENIDFKKPVEFRAWQKRDSKKIAFYIGQDDKKVEQKYTKDNPGDCPPARQRFDKTWDFDAQKEFFHRRITEVVIPWVHALNGNAQAEPVHDDGPDYGEDPFTQMPPKHEDSTPAPSQSTAAADDPFAKRPAPVGLPTGSAGPVTTVTLDTLKVLSQQRSDLDFNQVANRLFQRNVVDLTEGQAVAMIKYVGEL